MFLIHINNISYVCIIHYDILSKSCIEKMSICNIDKDTFVYMQYINFSISGTDKSILVYITCVHFSIHNIY